MIVHICELIREESPTIFYDSDHFYLILLLFFCTTQQEASEKKNYRNEHFMHVYQRIIGCKYTNEEGRKKLQEKTLAKRGAIVLVLFYHVDVKLNEPNRRVWIWSVVDARNANQIHMIKAHSKLVQKCNRISMIRVNLPEPRHLNGHLKTILDSMGSLC